jgi:ASC-1-like (ASCH) protein
MMTIQVKTIPKDEMRYASVGDWWFEKDTLEIRVVDLKNPSYEWFVAAHEITEALLCQKHGIAEKAVTNFDTAFEAIREANPRTIGDMEPGAMASAPYHTEHEAANAVEQLTVALFNENPSSYEKAILKALR